MAFKGPHSAETRAKIALARRGKKHSKLTRKKISISRRNQIPPNFKHGGYSKEATEATLEETCLRRLSALMELSENQIPTYVEPLVKSNRALRLF